MEHSKDFVLLDYGYNKASRKLVTVKQLKAFVQRGAITEEEFKLITGADYNR